MNSIACIGERETISLTVREAYRSMLRRNNPRYIVRAALRCCIDRGEAWITGEWRGFVFSRVKFEPNVDD